MNKTKIFITTMLVAALAAGCSKEDTNGDSTRDNVIRIFAGSFQNDSKVTYYLSDVNDADWVNGEKISLSCVGATAEFPIDGNDYDHYIYIEEDISPFTNSDLFALYPARDPANRVSLTNEWDNHEIVLDTLTIAKVDEERGKMAFPMAAFYTDDDSRVQLRFKHLCAGFKMRLSNVPPELRMLRIVALSEEADEKNFRFVVDLDGNGHYATARWGKHGNAPVLPAGPVGGNDEDVVVSNYSEMNFIVDESAVEGGVMDFCIPVTIQSFRSLVIVGYNENGEVLFKKTTNFNTEREVEVNRMYTLPDITLE